MFTKRWRWVVAVVLVVLGFALLGDAYAQGVGDTVRKLNYSVFRLMKGIAGLIMFGVGVWQFVEGYMQHQLQSKWLTFIGIAVFLVALSQAETIYGLLASSVSSEMGATTQSQGAVDLLGTPAAGE